MLKLGKTPYSIRLETNPDPKHSGKLDSAMVDGRSGGFSRGDKEYLGYIDNDLQVLFDMGKETDLSEVTISYLDDGVNGAFAPETIEIWSGADKDRLSKVAGQSSVLPATERAAAKGVIVLKFPKQTARYVRIKAKRFKALPSWNKNHGKGKPELFVDEVSLN